MNDGRHALLSSERFDWRTPPWFLDLVREVGPIGFDPCTTSDNPTGARLFATQTIEELDDVDGGRGLYSTACGLLDPWPVLEVDEVEFVNPPYGPHLSGDVDPHAEHWREGGLVGIGAGWAKRIAEERPNDTLVLVPARTETEWWRTLHDWCDCACLWSSRSRGSRINFVDATTGEIVRGSNLASTVFFKASRASNGPVGRAIRFAQVFGPHGTMIGP